MSNFQIAIDGPSGAGKSTVAKIVANQLNFIYVDTGAMYRSAALYGMRRGIDLTNEALVEAFIKNVDVILKNVGGGQIVLLNGEDITNKIRTQEVSGATSVISKVNCVRQKMTALQRQYADNYNVVMEGRDIGSVVLPNAQVKIYLDASASARAERRFRELIGRGFEADFQKIKSEVEQRDIADMNREISPLRRPDGKTYIADYIDSSDMTAQEAAFAILNIVNKKLGV
ncbi:MAG: (d)CMP kinase [Clostridiales bacterium]|nr:(d)CMP kinase [Clostridiales bacterium]